MKVFNSEYLTNLTTLAVGKPRKRQHQNIHESHKNLCQRLFNAIEPSSYIRPHMHGSDPKDELLIAVRGLMVLVIFDDQGEVTESVRFAASRTENGLAVGVEVPANTWHTVVSLEVGSILLEVKEGPFDPERPKDLAPWAPDENGPDAKHYLERLNSRILGCLY